VRRIATLLLPPFSSAPPAPLGADLDTRLGRADLMHAGEPGRLAQLTRIFACPGMAPAAAPLTRLLDAGDADQGRWLRADPAHVRADLATVRLLAVGGFGLAEAERDALARALRPMFGDLGFDFSAPHADRWYLRFAEDAPLPEFAPPERVLGADLGLHLPGGAQSDRFRRLLNECQMLLHGHPVNVQRAAEGRATVNSLWFWGAGVLPKRVHSSVRHVLSADPQVQALARLAGAKPVQSDGWAGTGAIEDLLIDLVPIRDEAAIWRAWLAPAMQALDQGSVDELRLLLPDGRGYSLAARHRWRLWRRSGALRVEP